MAKNGQALEQLSLRRCFHFKLTALYSGAVFLTLLAMAFVFYQLVLQSETQGLKQRLIAVATSLAQSVDVDAMQKIPLENAEFTPLHTSLLVQFAKVADASPDLDSIYVLRPTNEPTKLHFFVDYVRDGKHASPGEVYMAGDVPVMLKGFEKPVVEDEPVIDQFGLSLSGYAPIVDQQGRSVGVVGVDVLVSRLVVLQRQVMEMTLAVFGVATLLMVLVSVLVARSIRQPLQAMISATTAIAQGDYDAKMDFSRQDEFGVLGHCFEEMAKELKERQLIKDTFGRYVSEDVARALLEKGSLPLLGGEERVVTILFSDLRNYTSISEKLSPVQMIDMLNRYLGEMNKIIDNHRGCVIEFLGDGILAVFGAPGYFINHAEQAVQCASEMRKRLIDLNKEWEDSGLAQLWKQAGVDELSARIGLHTGSVVAGNLGSATRMKYSVIGDSVNVAARLEVLNKELGTSILLSEDVRHCLPVEYLESLHEEGVFSIKGRQQSIGVFSIA